MSEYTPHTLSRRDFVKKAAGVGLVVAGGGAIIEVARWFIENEYEGRRESLVRKHVKVANAAIGNFTADTGNEPLNKTLFTKLIPKLGIDPSWLSMGEAVLGTMGLSTSLLTSLLSESAIRNIVVNGNLDVRSLAQNFNIIGLPGLPPTTDISSYLWFTRLPVKYQKNIGDMFGKNFDRVIDGNSKEVLKGFQLKLVPDGNLSVPGKRREFVVKLSGNFTENGQAQAASDYFIMDVNLEADSDRPTITDVATLQDGKLAWMTKEHNTAWQQLDANNPLRNIEKDFKPNEISSTAYLLALAWHGLKDGAVANYGLNKPFDQNRFLPPGMMPAIPGFGGMPQNLPSGIR